MTQLVRFAKVSGLCTVLIVAGLMLSAAGVGFAPPCFGAKGSITPTVPAFGPRDGQPVLMVERDALIELPPGCLKATPDGTQEMRAQHFDLVFALAGRFAFEDTVEALAARVGSVSSLKSLRYWSVSDDEWSLLVNDVTAVRDATRLEPRADFTADEVLSGEWLHFNQDDNRSSGYNLFAMRSIERTGDRLVIEGINVSPIRFLFLSIFEPRGMRTLHFFQKLSADEWGYYGLSVVRTARFVKPERSLINRAAAYYRYLAGHDSTEQPPLAP
jgi:hypothetical protein